MNEYEKMEWTKWTTALIHMWGKTVGVRVLGLGLTGLIPWGLESKGGTKEQAQSAGWEPEWELVVF